MAALLGPQKWPHRVLPTITMGLGPLLAALVRQHLSVTLYRTVAQSLAAENAGRLAAMQVAEKNILASAWMSCRRPFTNSGKARSPKSSWM